MLFNPPPKNQTSRTEGYPFVRGISGSEGFTPPSPSPESGPDLFTNAVVAVMTQRPKVAPLPKQFRVRLSRLDVIDNLSGAHQIIALTLAAQRMALLINNTQLAPPLR